MMTDEEIINEAHAYLRRSGLRIQRVEVPIPMTLTPDEPDTAIVELVGRRSVVTRRYRRALPGLTDRPKSPHA